MNAERTHHANILDNEAMIDRKPRSAKLLDYRDLGPAIVNVATDRPYVLARRGINRTALSRSIAFRSLLFKSVISLSALT